MDGLLVDLADLLELNRDLSMPPAFLGEFVEARFALGLAAGLPSDRWIDFWSLNFSMTCFLRPSKTELCAPNRKPLISLKLIVR